MHEGLMEPQTVAREAAVVWVDRAHAVTIHVETGGRVTIVTTPLPGPAAEADETQALLGVIEAIGDAKRVLLLGDPATRTALEREYVTMRRQPERLVEVNLDETFAPVAAGR